MRDQSLKDKTVKGIGWSAVSNLAQYIVSFVVGIILARLLSPDDYGLIGIIAIFTAVCTVVIEGGFGSALIRKKDVTDEDYNTAFVVNLCLSIILYLIIYLCAPLIAVFFKRSELVLLTRVSSISMIVGALAFVQQTRLTKKIDFKTQTKITIIAAIASGVIGILMAFGGCGVWALVAQGLANQVIKTILLWIYNHWLPKFSFSINSFHELFGFGWKMMVSGVLDTVWKELYQVVVGKFYSSALLGQYTRAKQFSQLFSSSLTNVIQRVTFPVLSDIQDDKDRMVSAYRRIIKLTMFITVICMLSLGAVSEPLLYCLIGPKWHEASIYLPLICISSSLYPLHAINLNMLQVQGRSDLFLGLEIIKKVIGIAPLCVGIFVGILPMLYVNIGTGIISYFLNSYYSGKLIGYSSWMQIKDFAPSYIIAFVVGVPIYMLKYLPISNWLILPLQVLLDVVLLWSICRYTRNEEFFEIKQLVLPYIDKIKQRNGAGL